MQFKCLADVRSDAISLKKNFKAAKKEPLFKEFLHLIKCEGGQFTKRVKRDLA